MRGAAFLAALAATAAVALPARADIALLANGRTLKVERASIADGRATLVLPGGGEFGIDAAELVGVVPDEVVEEVERGDLDGEGLRALASAAAKKHGLDPALVLAVVQVESGFRPDAISPKGAQGLMQLMPKTAAGLGVADAFDPAQNLDGGARYLRQLVTRYEGDLTKALAAYNAGEGAVAKHRGVPPYAETRAYVKNVLRRYQPEP
jgi:soluble lytic murein transglycosylase-like protein